MSNNLMPPPRRLYRTNKCHLQVRSFEGFASQVAEVIVIESFEGLKQNRSAKTRNADVEASEFRCECGFQIFAINTESDDSDLGCFRASATLELLNEGKCGIAFRLDRDTHNGYYLSLDLFKGVAQIRAWGSGPDGSGGGMMQFRSLQAAYWDPKRRGRAEIVLLACGSYLELSVGGRVMLSLADQTFASGLFGFCVESGTLRVSHLHLERFVPTVQSDEHLANG